MKTAEDRQVVLVSLPRGITATVEFNPKTGAVRTDHAGLQVTLFKEGVLGLDGRRLFPIQGSAFLSAVYDFLFLNGYAVEWRREPEPGAAGGMRRDGGG